jgi:hypothetical protein
MSSARVIVIIGILLFVALGIYILVDMAHPALNKDIEALASDSQNGKNQSGPQVEPSLIESSAYSDNPEQSDYDRNKVLLADDMQNFASETIQFFRAPSDQKGAGNELKSLTPARLAAFLNFYGPNHSISTYNGEIRITGITGSLVILKGLGTKKKDNKFNLVTTTVNVSTGNIDTEITDAASF